MRVRVIQSFDGYRRGDEFDWTRPVVKLLAARGLVEVLEDRADVETAEVRQAVETASIDSRPRRRRR